MEREGNAGIMREKVSRLPRQVVLWGKTTRFGTKNISRLAPDDGSGYSADEHNILVAKEMLSFVHNITLFADKACCDQSWSEN
jgi:hypothetical protein